MAANWLIYSLVSWTPALRFDLIKIYSENCIMTAPPGVQSECINSIELLLSLLLLVAFACNSVGVALPASTSDSTPHSLPSSSPSPDVPPMGSQNNGQSSRRLTLTAVTMRQWRRGGGVVMPWGGSVGLGKRGYLQLARLQSMLNRIFSQASKIS